MRNYHILLCCWLGCTVFVQCDEEKNIVKRPDNPGVEKNKPMSEVMPFPGSAKVRVTIQIPRDWIIDNGIARVAMTPGAEPGKRIEFSRFFTKPYSEPKSFRRMLKTYGFKILREKPVSKKNKLVITENPKVEGESGDSAGIGHITKICIVDDRDRYQYISFFEIPGSTNDHALILQMIESVQVEVLQE
ncbi:MAG: hypothetical protein KF713_11235 [Turneriella sp.]|nr:hypothetical protein [Turneriella sp.]